MAEIETSLALEEPTITFRHIRKLTHVASSQPGHDGALVRPILLDIIIAQLIALEKMKKILASLIFIFVAPASYAELSAQHPIYGQWTWTVPSNRCTEVYRYKPDNTGQVSSGEEIAESRFTLSEKPDQNGFYRMTDVVTKSNGKAGCDGTEGGSPVGDEATNYLILNAARDKLLICQEASFKLCFGPLQRVLEK